MLNVARRTTLLARRVFACNRAPAAPAVSANTRRLVFRPTRAPPAAAAPAPTARREFLPSSAARRFPPKPPVAGPAQADESAAERASGKSYAAYRCRPFRAAPSAHQCALGGTGGTSYTSPQNRSSSLPTALRECAPSFPQRP